MADYDSYRVLAGRIRMHVMDWQGEDPPVVFLHSFTANGLAALPLGNLLEEQYRLIAPDLRGRGRSDMPFGEYGIQVHINDVMACMDRLGVERFVAAGHSFGATLSIFLAAQFPERVCGLMLFDGGAVPSANSVEFLDAYYNTLQYHYASAEDYVDRYRNAPLYQPWTPELETLVRSNLLQQPDGTFFRRVPRFVVDADRRVEQLETLAQLPDLYRQITCPILILRAGMGITGVEDQVLTDDVLASMLDALPSAIVITVPEAGHTSLLTVPNLERDAAILGFLKQPL